MERWQHELLARTGRGRGCAAAVVAAASGDRAGTLAALEVVAMELPEVRPAANARRCELMLSEPADIQTARRLLESLPDDALSTLRLRALLAVKSADDDSIIAGHPLLLRAPDLAQPERAKLWLQLGDAHAQKGNPGAARDAWATLLVEHPRSDAATVLEQRIAVQRRPLPLSADEWARRLTKLVQVAMPKKAAVEGLLLLDRLRGTAGAQPVTVQVATVTALVRAGRMDEALALSDRFTSPTSGVADGLLEVRAWTLAKADKRALAANAWRRLAAATQDPDKQNEATFLAAFSVWEGGSLAASDKAFAAALPALVGSVWEGPVRWYLGLGRLLRGEPALAVPVLEDLVRILPNDKEVLKHRYWLARARIESGQRESGAQELSALAQKNAEFYGMLARRRLGLPPLPGLLTPPNAVLRRAREDDASGTARLLWSVGFDDDARRVARALGTKLPEIGLLQLMDDAHFGWRRGALFLPFPRSSQRGLRKSDGWRVSYATPWSKVVGASARRHGLPASFVYAIMRTETGFDAGAVSVAGARGVIQLMPSTARGAALLAGRAASDADRIFDPVVAIDLGAALLGANHREFESLLLTAAAYNGGADNVVAWMRRFGSLEVELFIERIPFRETRDYVKKVLATEAIYRALDGAAWALELPERIGAPPKQATHFPIDE